MILAATVLSSYLAYLLEGITYSTKYTFLTTYLFRSIGILEKNSISKCLHNDFYSFEIGERIAIRFQ